MSEYDVDFYAWTQRQGGLLRRLATGERVNDADLDWPNIAEEIETSGRSERGAVASCIRNIIQHLMKLEASPATDPRPGWRATVRRERVELEAVLDDNPSLKPAVDGLIAREMPRVLLWLPWTSSARRRSLMRRGSLMRRNKSLATGFPTNLSDPTRALAAAVRSGRRDRASDRSRVVGLRCWQRSTDR
jgi:hypothetical protein